MYNVIVSDTLHSHRLWIDKLQKATETIKCTQTDSDKISYIFTIIHNFSMKLILAFGDPDRVCGPRMKRWDKIQDL